MKKILGLWHRLFNGWKARELWAGGPSVLASALALVLCSAVPADGQPVYSTNAVGFKFSPGTVLDGATNSESGTVWHAAGPVGPKITVVAGNLPVPGLPAPEGNRARIQGVAGPASRVNLDTNGTMITTGVVFYSLALRVTDLGTFSTNGGTLVGFNDATGPSQNLPRPLAAGLALRSVSAGQLGLSLRTDESGDQFWPDGWWWDFAPDQTVGVVASFNPGSGVANLWINPNPAEFGASTAPPPDLTTTTTNVMNKLSSFVLMQQPTLPAVTLVDEVRLGTTWAAVTPPSMDFGDAPEGAFPYPTTLARNGARHGGGPLFFGALKDLEPDGKPTISAVGDDNAGAPNDEDGIVFGGSWVPGGTVWADITVSAPGRVDAWADWNQMSAWEPAEIIVASGTVNPGPPVRFQFTVPIGAPSGDTYARFRLSGAGGLTPVGFNLDGEVSDLRVAVFPRPDLVVTATALPNPVIDGSNLTYSITVRNVGAGVASGIVVNSLTDNEATWTDSQLATPSQGACSNTATGIVCSLGALQPGGTATISVVGIPDFNKLATVLDLANSQESISMSNTVTVTSAEPDASPADNSAIAVAAIVPLRDFGDAPDLTIGPAYNYPTHLVDNGARHRIGGPFFGGSPAGVAQRDPDPDGAPTLNADGDDVLDANDDEEGIQFLDPIYPGATSVRARINAPVGGKVDAWLDFNRNGQWGLGAPEQIFTSLAVAAGTFDYTFNVPAGAVLGSTCARFRISTLGGLGFTGYASDGEVEDLRLDIVPQPPQPDLVVAATVTTGQPVVQGSNIVYSITVSNAGPGAASGVVVSSRLTDNEATWTDAVISTPSQGSCSNSAAGIVCDLGTLQPGAKATIFVVDAPDLLRNLPDSQESLNATNLVTVTLAEADANPANNSAAAIVAVVPQRDFGDAPAPAYPTLLPTAARHRLGALRFGTFIDSEANGQPVDLDDAVGAADEVTDGFGLLPGGFYAGGLTPITIQVSGPAGYIDLWFDTDGTPGWSAADQVLAHVAHPGGGAVVGYVVSLPASAVPGLTWARARVSLSPAGLPPGGYGGVGEVVDFQMNILPAAVDLVVVEPGPIEVTEGDPLTLTLTVSNKGPSTATSLVLEIPYPSGATLDAFQTSQGTGGMEGTNLVVRLGTLAANASATVTFTAGTSNVFGAIPDEFTWWCWDTFALEPELTPDDNTHHGLVGVAAKRDFGDAPDLTVGPAYNYPTRLVDNGARHRIVGPYFGGSAPALDRDRDPDGTPTLNADGDDVLDANDDEEGIQFLDPIYPGATGVRVRINAPLGGTVDAWVDFNRNGQWGMGAPEQIFTSLVVAAGTFDYTFNVPPGAVVGPTYARFRISSMGGLAPTGYATNGEVQDLTINIVPAIDLDIVAVSTTTLRFDDTEPLPLALLVTNHSSSTASSVQFAATLPPYVTVQFAACSNGVCQVMGSNVTCQMTSLAPGQNSRIDLIMAAATENLPGDEFFDIFVGDEAFRVSAAEPELNPVDNQLALPGVVVFARDWGDAPGGFPVTSAEGGARHRRKAGFFLGAGWDRETSGTHSPNADFDDLNGVTPDDEDGITFTKTLAPGAPAYVTVQASAAGLLDAWIDFNSDGDWADAGEQIFASQPLTVGANALTFAAPAGAKAGVTFSRWRLSETGGLGYDGAGGNGEVEDHPVTIAARLDFGDAPEVIAGAPAITTTYEVTLARDGGRHEPTGLLLGTAWDKEIDGQPSVAADLDDLTGVPDDEDGWTPVPFVVGTMMTLNVYVTGGNGVLDVWVDWDHNYNWDVPEHQVVAYPVVPGANAVPITVPGGIPTGQTYARFRLSTAGCPLPSGYSADGECEDYVVTVNSGGGNPNPVYFAGLAHTSLSNAIVSINANGLTIANIGSNGMDGVSIGLKDVPQGAGLSFGSNGFALPGLAGFGVSAYGTTSNTVAQFLGSVRFENGNNAVNGYIENANAFPLRVEGYHGNNLVGSYPVPEDGSIGTFFGDFRLRSLSFVAESGQDAFFDVFTELGYQPPGQPSTMAITRLRLVSVGSADTIRRLERLIVTGRNLDSLTITDETISKFGHWHRFLGDATLQSAPPGDPGAGLIVAVDTFDNGAAFSDDGDGFEVIAGGNDVWDDAYVVSLPRRVAQAWPDDWEMPWLTSSNGHVRWTMTGRVQGSSNAFENLSDLTAFKQEQGTVLRVVFDAPMSVTQVQVDMFNGPDRVGSVTLPVGNIGTLASIVKLRRVVGQINDEGPVWTLTGGEPWNFQPATGSPALVCDRLRITALAPAGAIEGIRSLITRGANVESFTLRGFNTAAPQRPKLSLLSLGGGGGTLGLTFPTETDVLYELERSSSVDGPWDPVGRKVGTDGTNSTTFDPGTQINGTIELYRIRVR